MAINLDFLSDQSTKDRSQKYVYADLHLDFKLQSSLSNIFSFSIFKVLVSLFELEIISKHTFLFFIVG